MQMQLLTSSLNTPPQYFWSVIRKDTDTVTEHVPPRGRKDSSFQRIVLVKVADDVRVVERLLYAPRIRRIQ
jgi:hypothetical protein